MVQEIQIARLDHRISSKDPSNTGNKYLSYNQLFVLILPFCFNILLNNLLLKNKSLYQEEGVETSMRAVKWLEWALELEQASCVSWGQLLKFSESLISCS